MKKNGNGNIYLFYTFNLIWEEKMEKKKRKW